jgi:hypothetical protein
LLARALMVGGIGIAIAGSGNGQGQNGNGQRQNGNGQGQNGNGGHPSAPELNSKGLASGMALLIGSVLVLVDRRQGQG